MAITGTVNRVTNQQAFLLSVVVPADPTALNLAAANPASFTPSNNRRVTLRAEIPGVAQIPTLVDTTDAAGRFSFNSNTMESLPSLSILAERVAATVSVGGVQVPVFEPIFRSAPFNPTNLNGPIAIFVLPQPNPAPPPITQASVVAAIAGAPAIAGVTSLGGRISSSNRIHVVARGTAGPIPVRVSFDVHLKPVTSSNLARLVRGPIEDFTVDPFVANLCVSEATISGAIRGVLATLNAGINAAITAALPAIPGFNVASFVNTNVTVTCSDIDTTVTGMSLVGGLLMPVRQVDLDIRAALPRRIA